MAEEYKNLIDKYNKSAKNRSFSDFAPAYRYPPKVIDYKIKIIDWITFWWFSMIQTVLGDWLHKLVVFVYNIFYNIYDNIAKSIFADIKVPSDDKK